MLKINRVCVPLGLACNIQCRFCLRDAGKTRVPRLNDLMKRYVEQLEPTWCEALVVTGGEPLLYKNRMFELFELNPRVHRKIMTNGLLVTDELADYCNKNRIELQLSHDGAMTKFLRGVDVLQDPELVRILRKFDIVRVNAVTTKYNTNAVEVYDYIRTHLGRDDFHLTINPLYDTGQVNDLLEGFDYAEYLRSNLILNDLIPLDWAFNRKPVRMVKKQDISKYSGALGVNVMPDGDVVSMFTMRRYGTVEDDRAVIWENIRASGDYDRCYSNATCNDRMRHNCLKQLASPHFCKIRLLRVTGFSQSYE